MNAKTNGILNPAFIRRYRCAQCWGGLVEKYLSGEWRVVCPKACQPGGFVTAATVYKNRARSSEEHAEVIKNYPQFAPPKSTPEQVARNKKLLFGE